jgi:hypothetical protein
MMPTKPAASTHESYVVPCGVSGCPKSALPRIKLPGGYFSACLIHYEEHYAKVAKEYCESKGLDTHEKMVAFCKQGMSKIGSRKLPPLPEPPALPRPKDEEYVEI